MQVRPATRGLQLRKKKSREGSLPKHGQVTSHLQKFYLLKAFLTFPLAVTTDFQSSKKKKNSSEIVSNHSKIKTWWQQSITKCYHLLVSWSCHYHPPLKLFPVSLCQMTKYCTEPESLLLHLQTTSQRQSEELQARARKRHQLDSMAHKSCLSQRSGFSPVPS